MVFRGKTRLSKLLQHGGGLPHTIDLAEAAEDPGEDQVDRVSMGQCYVYLGVFPKMVVRCTPKSSHLFVGFPIIFTIHFGVPLSVLLHWLVVSTHLKNIIQNGNLAQIGVKIKNI